MVTKLLKYCCLLLLLGIAQNAAAQGHLFSEVTVSPERVYVGQPAQISVAVYTSTWFTKGVNPGNVKVNGAFTIFFSSLAESKTVNGKSYAGVKMTFNVFPYDDEDLIFPSVEIRVETPDEGSSKGVARVIKTTAKKIIVRSVPSGYARDKWMVASGMKVGDSWIGNKTNIKVGDVLERIITRDVSGTVSELIPPIKWDTLDGISQYSKRPVVENRKTRTEINASRTEGIRYLFEREGKVTFPEMVFTWWNPNQKKLYKRTLKSVTLEVNPNPDLGMLESVRDSLELESADQDQRADENSERKIMGLSIKQFSVILLIFFVLLYFLVKGIKWLSEKYKIYQQNYINSELFYFRQFISAAKSKKTKAAVQSLYRWIDQIRLIDPTLHFFVQTYGKNELIDEVNQIEEYLNSGSTSELSFNLRLWSAARKNFINGNIQRKNTVTNLALNP